MIAREDVADLRAGDVVELRDERWPDVVVRGPVGDEQGALKIGGYAYLRWEDGETPSAHRYRTLTVISRAKPSLYVNHPRTEPADGDTVRDADDDGDEMLWIRLGDRWWEKTDNRASRMPKRLRLLVDGRTGQVVP